MGCITQKQQKELSPKLRDKILAIFRKMDVDGSKSIDKEETAKYWKTNFAKLNTNELFKAVDFDNSGCITEDEWLAFWQIVKKSGHSEKEITEELDNLLEGKAWVKFNKVDEFIKRDQKQQKGQNVNKIVDQERKQLNSQMSINKVQKNNQEVQNAQEDKDLQNIKNKNF